MLAACEFPCCCSSQSSLSSGLFPNAAVAASVVFGFKSVDETSFWSVWSQENAVGEQGMRELRKSLQGYLSLSTYLDLTEKDDESCDQILIGSWTQSSWTQSSFRPLVEGGRFPGWWWMESRSCSQDSAGDLCLVVWPWLDTPHLSLGAAVRDEKLPGGRSAASLCASLAPTQPPAWG